MEEVEEAEVQNKSVSHAGTEEEQDQKDEDIEKELEMNKEIE